MAAEETDSLYFLSSCHFLARTELRDADAFSFFALLFKFFSECFCLHLHTTQRVTTSSSWATFPFQK